MSFKNCKFMIAGNLLQSVLTPLRAGFPYHPTTLLGISLLVWVVSCGGVQSAYLQHKAEGWHFYEDLSRPSPEPSSPASAADSLDPVAQLSAFKKEVERLKAVAVMSPTFENVQAYMKIQKHLMQQASRFAQRWMEVVYTTPTLDYTIQHPTSQMARHVYLDEQASQMNVAVAQLAQSHGLFFFFSATCAYCKNFAPIVKAFSRQYGWEVMAISMDGSSLPEFPNAVVDNGAAAQLGVQFVPTLLAVNPTTEEVIPLSHGMNSQDQILDRIRVLIMERSKR